MAGCTTGIETIEVKAPNGKPSLLFQGLVEFHNGDINASYYSYLKTQTSKFIGEMEKRPIKDRDRNGEYLLESVNQVLNLTESGLFSLEATVAPEVETSTESLDESPIKAILEQSKLIIDPEVDSEGNQANVYGITSTPNGAATSFLGRVSGLISEFSLRKREMVDDNGKPFPNEVEAYIYRDTKRNFANLPKDGTYREADVEYTREQYAEMRRARYKQSMVKGNIIHAMLQLVINFGKKGTPEYSKIENNLAELEGQSDKEAGFYSWVQEKKNFTAIMRNAGIVIDPTVPAPLRDQVHAEVAVAHPLIAAGKIDTLVNKASGRLKIVDYKTGNSFDRTSIGRQIMKYGNQEFNIVDNAMGKAKLQAMIYSVIIKASHPSAQFEIPVIMHIPDESSARSPRNVHQVEVRDYLRMIEQYYKNERPEDYKELLRQSPQLFNPTEYGSSYNGSLTQDMIEDGSGRRLDEVLNKYEIQLEQLVTGVAIRNNKSNDNYKGVWMADELRLRDSLMRKIAQARTTLALPSGSTKDYEIKAFTQWLGTINDTQNPYIQAYSQIVQQARLKVYEEYENVEQEFNTKMTKVLEEKIGKQSGLARAFKPMDKQAVFSKLISNQVLEDEAGYKQVSRGLITENDPGWTALTAAEKDLVLYMRTKMQEVFNHVMVDGPSAVVSNHKGRNRTKLDIYNDNAKSAFKMTDSFIPKMAITSSEVKWNMMRNGLPGVGNFLKHEYTKHMTMFYEDMVEGDNQNHYGIPVKFLGSGTSIHKADIHTSNLEVAFKGFMQHMINKKHYDSVYAIGDSVKGYLALQKDAQGNDINAKAADFVGYHMHRNLIGRIDDKGDNFWRKSFSLGVKTNGEDVYFSPIKFMRAITSLTAASALWLKIPASAKNAGQAMWAVGKESMVNSMATTKWGGVSVDTQDLSAKNHARAYGQWMDYQKKATLGSGKTHPVHVFMKTFHMYPDMTELGNSRKNMVVDGATALDVNHAYLLYSYPEAMTAAVIAMDAMMTMKVQSGPYAGQSMWDVYSKSIVTDPITGEGKFELPADFTRGKIRMGDGTLQELKGLNSLEVAKLHRIVQNVKGGYRPEERSMLESTAIGEMFMLFRRWLPMTIVRGMKGKYYDSSIGSLAKTETEDVYEWQARLVEGRWRTMAGVIAEYGMRLSGNKQRRGYAWDDLSAEQRKNVLDAALTFSTWAVTGSLISLAFADVDDEDSVKKWASEMNMRLIDQWNFIDWAKASTDMPVVIKRSLELLTGMGQLGMATQAAVTGGEDEDIYTRRGDLRGSNQVLKNLPVTAIWYDANRFIDNTDYWED